MARVLVPTLVLVLAVGCDREASRTDEAKPAPAPRTAVATADPTLARDQAEYVEDVVAFTGTTHAEVRARMQRGSVPLKEEWEAWEREGPMTPARIKQFYKQTANYIYELAEWHLWVPGKRASDLELVAQLRAKQPKNILDFGGGVGLTALPLARAGLDVTLADLEGTSLAFAAFRAKRRDVTLKLWKADVEPMPPDAKYDVIMALDVLEHLPKDELHAVVDKLIQLKHAGTEIVISAPFGRTAVHPMHLDADAETQRQVARLQTELPKAP